MWARQQRELSPVATKSTIKIIYSDQKQSFSLEKHRFFSLCGLCRLYAHMHTCLSVCLLVCLIVHLFIVCRCVVLCLCQRLLLCFFLISREFSPFHRRKKAIFSLITTKKGKRRERKWECVSVCTRLSNFFFFFLLENVIRNRREENNIGYGHTKRKAPLLARSVKLSLFGLG